MMKNKVTGKIALFLVCVMFLGMLTACEQEQPTKVVFTTGFGKDEVFRIGNAVCTKPEIMVYLTTTQNRYENVYGAEIWNVSLDDVTLEDNVKETVLAKIAQIKTMCLLGESKEIALDEQEEQLVEEATEIYWRGLSDAEVERLGVKKETIQNLYREYALANKVYEFLIKDINPEISDDEARIVTVQQIVFQTWTTDGSGTRIEYGDDVKETVYQTAREALDKAVSGEEEFEELASKYSQESDITVHFRKGEAPEGIESVIYSLETGEISGIVETDNGYYIFKCINTFNREETDANKLQIVEQRRREVFGEEYDAFTETLVRQLNTKLWDEIELIRDDRVNTTNFFEVYDRVFQ